MNAWQIECTVIGKAFSLMGEGFFFYFELLIKVTENEKVRKQEKNKENKRL